MQKVSVLLRMELAKALCDKVADTLMLETGIKSSYFIWFGLLRNSGVNSLTAKMLYIFGELKSKQHFV